MIIEITDADLVKDEVDVPEITDADLVQSSITPSAAPVQTADFYTTMKAERMGLFKPSGVEDRVTQDMLMATQAAKRKKIIAQLQADIDSGLSPDLALLAEYGSELKLPEVPEPVDKQKEQAALLKKSQLAERMGKQTANQIINQAKNTPPEEQFAESDTLGDVSRAVASTSLGVAGAGLGMVKGLTDLNEAIPVPQFIKNTRDKIAKAIGVDKIPAKLNSLISEVGLYRNQIKNEIVKESGGGGMGIAANVVSDIADGATETALTLAGLGVSGFVGKGATIRHAIKEAAKFGGFTYATTPGTQEEKLEAAAHSAAFMLTPIPAAKLPTTFLAKFVNVVENIGINSPTYFDAVKQAKANAAANGTPDKWIGELVKIATPIFVNDLIFGLAAQSKKASLSKAKKVAAEEVLAEAEPIKRGILMEPPPIVEQPTRIELPKQEGSDAIPKPVATQVDALTAPPDGKAVGRTYAEGEVAGEGGRVAVEPEGAVEAAEVAATPLNPLPEQPVAAQKTPEGVEIPPVEAKAPELMTPEGKPAEPTPPPAAPPVKKGKGKKPTLSERRAAASGQDMTIEDVIAEEGGIKAHAGKDLSEELYGVKGRDGPVGISLRPKEGGGQTADIIADILVDRGLLKPKPEQTPEQALLEYLSNRKTKAKLDLEDQQRITYEQGQIADAEEWTKAQNSLRKSGKGEEANPHTMDVGGTFTINGERHRVKAEGETGLRIQDGAEFWITYTRPAEKTARIFIDKGSYKEPEVKTEPVKKPSMEDVLTKDTFGLVGGKAPEVKAAEPRGPETIQTEMFEIQKVVNIVDPELSANFAEQNYGGAKSALAKVKNQLKFYDSNPKIKKDFPKEARLRLNEVIRLLEQRAAKPAPTEKGFNATPLPVPGMAEAAKAAVKQPEPIIQTKTTEVRPIDDIMNEKVEQTHKDLKKESSAGFARVWFGKEPPKTEGVERVSDVLEAGRRYPPGPISKIVDKVKNIGRILEENFVTFMARNKANPQFVDDWRTEVLPMRDRQIKKIMNWRFGTEGKLYKHEGREGVEKAVDILYTKDLISRGEEGMELPNGLTVSELKSHLTWLESVSSTEAKDTANTIRQIFDAQGKELVKRGKIEEARKEYAPHMVMDYEPEWMKQKMNFPMKSKFGEPYRGYTKQAVGSKRLIRTDEEGVWSHIFKVEMDNMQEDVMLKFAKQYDAKAKWIEQEKARGRTPTLRKGTMVKIDGKDYEAIEWKKTFFEQTAVDKPMLEHAIENDMMVKDWLDMRGSKGGEPTRPVVAIGKPKLFLIPKDIAYQLKNMTEKTPDVFNLVYELGRMTQVWKKFTLGTSGIQYHVGNLLGDTINTALFDPIALRPKYIQSAIKVAEHIFYSKNTKLTPFQEELMKLALDKDVATSGQYSGELRKYGGLEGVGGKYEKANGFRESINRLAILAHQLDRIKSGKRVQRVAGLNLEGLDSNSAAGKVARESLGDYTAVPRAYTLFLSRGATPFVRFHEANARNHLRAAFKTPESALKYWLPLLTAYGSSFAWNNSEKNKKDEMALPDYIRDRLHIVYGRDKEGKIRVWAPQQPIDMAWSWIGMDHVSRVLSDKRNGRIKTWEDAGKQFLGEVATAPVKNVSALLNPVIQFFQGLDRNADPFSGRKIMPDDIFKIYKESRYSNALLDKRTRGFVVNYFIEKMVSPIAQYTRITQGTEPTEHPVFDLIKRNFFGIGQAVGIRHIDPLSGETARRQKSDIDQKATRSYWKAKTFDILNDYGNKQELINQLIADAPEDDFIKRRIIAWTRTPQAKLATINYHLRSTKDEKERAALLQQREEYKRRIMGMPPGWEDKLE